MSTRSTYAQRARVSIEREKFFGQAPTSKSQTLCTRSQSAAFDMRDFLLICRQHLATVPPPEVQMSLTQRASSTHDLLANDGFRKGTQSHLAVQMKRLPIFSSVNKLAISVYCRLLLSFVLVSSISAAFRVVWDCEGEQISYTFQLQVMHPVH